VAKRVAASNFLWQTPENAPYLEPFGWERRLMSDLALWLKFILEMFRASLKYLEKRKIRRGDGGSIS
jgi:hypothetical protein